MFKTFILENTFAAGYIVQQLSYMHDYIQALDCEELDDKRVFVGVVASESIMQSISDLLAPYIYEEEGE